MPKVSAPPTAPPPAAIAAMPGSGPGPGTGFQVPPGAPPPVMGTNSASQMVNTGLASKFNGRALSLWYLPRKYSTGKKANTYSLFAEINIQADDPELGKGGIVTEYYKVDDLNQWVPSRTDPVYDGTNWIYTPAGGTLDQYMALHQGALGWPDPTGKVRADGSPETAVMPPDDWRGWYTVPGKQRSHDGFPNSTKWGQFLKELDKPGIEYGRRCPHINVNDLRQFLVGVYGYWVRLPFEFKGGLAPDLMGGDGKQNQLDTLCLQEILDLGPISGATGPTATTLTTLAPAILAAPATLAPATNDVLTQLVTAKGQLTKAEAGVAVYEKVGAEGLLLLNNQDWMVGDDRTFGYDAARGLLVPLPT